MKNHLIYGKLHFSQFDRSHTFQTDFNVTSAESNDESSVCLNWINLWLEIGWLFTILYLISSWFNQVFSELLNDAFLADSPENMYFRIVTENQPLCLTSINFNHWAYCIFTVIYLSLRYVVDMYAIRWKSRLCQSMHSKHTYRARVDRSIRVDLSRLIIFVMNSSDRRKF